MLVGLELIASAAGAQVRPGRVQTAVVTAVSVPAAFIDVCKHSGNYDVKYDGIKSHCESDL